MQGIRNIWARYGKHAPLFALVLGFVWDALTLARPDRLFENLTAITYLLLGAVLIVALQLVVVRTTRTRVLMVLTALQFVFGNLASAMLILYIRSGALVGSILFAGMLGALLFANEFLRTRYERTVINISMWFMLLLTYATIVVPIAAGAFGDGIFLLGVLLSLALVAVLIFILFVFWKDISRVRHHSVFASIGLVTVVFTTLYIFGGIPPVPLAAKHIGIYHTLIRQDDGYHVAFEEPRWYALWRDTDSTYTYDKDGDIAYCLSAVFVPRGIATTLYHHWEYQDANGAWKTFMRTGFTVYGGRDGGYRGYTYTNHLTPGVWRCSAETERGAVVGRTVFHVQHGVPLLTNDVL